MPSEPAFTDEQIDRAVEALSDPDRFREAEARVARMAPQLQRILNEALHSGGWFGEAHESQVRRAAAQAMSTSAVRRSGPCSPRRRAWACSWVWRLDGSCRGNYIPVPITRPKRRRPDHMPDVEFQANGATAPGYLATPESGSGPGVVVHAGVVGPGLAHQGRVRPLCVGGLLRPRARPLPG